jgi:hypothetical protein
VSGQTQLGDTLLKYLIEFSIKINAKKIRDQEASLSLQKNMNAYCAKCHNISVYGEYSEILNCVIFSLTTNDKKII